MKSIEVKSLDERIKVIICENYYYKIIGVLYMSIPAMMNINILGVHFIREFLWTYLDFKDILELNITCKWWHMVVSGHQNYWRQLFNSYEVIEGVRNPLLHNGVMYRWCINFKEAKKLQMDYPLIGRWGEYWEEMDEAFHQYCCIKEHWVYSHDNHNLPLDNNGDKEGDGHENDVYYRKFMYRLYSKLDDANLLKLSELRGREVSDLVDKLSAAVDKYDMVEFFKSIR